MSILDSLKFVSGAVARKDFIPELCAVFIHEGKISAYDGLLSISCPIDIEITAAPLADPFIKAIKACEPGEPLALSMTKAGRLSVKSGKFKAFVDCVPDADVRVKPPQPEGQEVPVTEAFFAGIKKLAPVMGIDASRPWCRSIRLFGPSIFASNNIIVAEYWHGSPVAIEIVIPAEAVIQYLSAGRVPIKLLYNEDSVSFLYEDGAWIRSQLLVDGWPVDPTKIFKETAKPVPVAEGFFAAVKKIKPFAADDILYCGTGKVATGEIVEDDKNQAGAIMEVDIVAEVKPVFSLHNMLLLDGIADKLDFESYPEPSAFTGQRTRGVIAGRMRPSPA